MSIGIRKCGYPGPDSNAERQRRFRKRNPDYYKQYRARQKAAIASFLASQRLAAAQAAATEPAAACPEGVWITLPALTPVPVEAAKPEAVQPMVMRVVEG